MIVYTVPPGHTSLRVMVDRGAELGGCGATVEPQVLAADAPVGELPEVEHPERHAAPMARDTEERALHGAGPLMLGHAEVRAVVATRRGHGLGVDLARELFVEAAGGVATRERPVQRADDVVLDVIGVHGH
jgi:hypothetical protein